MFSPGKVGLPHAAAASAACAAAAARAAEMEYLCVFVIYAARSRFLY